MSVVSLDLHPETNTIHLFAGHGLAPTETATLKGHVQLKLSHHIQVRQITVRLEGVVRSIISNDMGYFKEASSNNVPLWPTTLRHRHDLSLVSRMTHRAVQGTLGFPDAVQVILKTQTHLLHHGPEVTCLEAGTHRWPFEIHINNAQTLPASILLFRHMIRYQLSAHLQLASFKELVKINFWRARANMSHLALRPLSFPFSKATTPRRRNSTPSVLSSTPSSTSSSHPSSETLSQPNSARVSSLDHEPHDFLPENDTFITRLEEPPQTLCVSKVIRVHRHRYFTLDMLAYVPHTSYTGQREGQMEYMITVPRFACLQRNTLDLACSFSALSDSGRIASIEVFLEQKERYPLRSGKIKASDRWPSYLMTERVTRPIRMQYDVNQVEPRVTPTLSLSLKSNHIVQDVDASSLQITHAVRLAIHFVDSLMRKMNLCIPVELGTVPCIAPPHENPVADMWFPDEMATDTLAIAQLTGSTGSDDLPSYCDVLRESAPPNPYLNASSHGPSLSHN